MQPCMWIEWALHSSTPHLNQSYGAIAHLYGRDCFSPQHQVALIAEIGGVDLRAIFLYIHMKGRHSPVKRKRVHLYTCGWHSSSVETAACFLTVCEPLCTLYPQSRACTGLLIYTHTFTHESTRCMLGYVGRVA